MHFPMIYAPHILQRKVATPLENDEFGRPVPDSGIEEWKDVCECRCDDNTTNDFTSSNGSTYRPKFHVVCGLHIDIKAGDEVRCVDGESVRAQGKAYMVKVNNFFNYSEIWI